MNSIEINKRKERGRNPSIENRDKKQQTWKRERKGKAGSLSQDAAGRGSRRGDGGWKKRWVEGRRRKRVKWQKWQKWKWEGACERVMTGSSRRRTVRGCTVDGSGIVLAPNIDVEVVQRLLSMLSKKW